VPSDSLFVLLVEDNPGDVALFKYALEEAYGSNFDLMHCGSLSAALERLSRTQPDVIVVDLGLPDACGTEVIKRCHALAPLIPIVVSTGRDDEAVGLQALHEGAQDYLIKGEMDPRMLARALRYAIERKRMQAALQNESVIDELTQLYNRKGLLTLADKLISSAAHTTQPITLAFVDLDGLKQINDTLGHLAGDQALKEAAALLGGCIRQSDILARFGGDEFVLLLTPAGRDAEALIHNRMQRRLHDLNSLPARRYRLSLSIGMITTTADEALTLETLLTRADRLMYQEKQAKRLALETPAPISHCHA